MINLVFYNLPKQKLVVMKYLKRKTISGYNILIKGLLTLLGFSTACQIGADAYGVPPAPAYGVPMATFIVKGEVTSKVTSQPIEGIQVVMEWDTAFTDNNGIYETKLSSGAGSNMFAIQFRDVDGVANGEFLPLDTTVEFKDPIFTGGSGYWDEGTAEETLNVQLKPKE